MPLVSNGASCCTEAKQVAGTGRARVNCVRWLPLTSPRALSTASSSGAAEYALRSMAQSMNIVTLGFGVFILYLAILTSLAQQAYVPKPLPLSFPPGARPKQLHAKEVST